MIAGRLSPDEGTNLLDSLSHIHRLGEQAEKSSRYWSSLSPVEHRSPVIGRHESQKHKQETSEEKPEEKQTDKSPDVPLAVN